MPKSKTRKKRKKRQKQTKKKLLKPAPKRSWLTILLFSWKSFVIYSILIGAFVATYAFYPRISIRPTSPIIPNDAFSTPFIIKNEGAINITKVRFLYKIINIEAPLKINPEQVTFSYSEPIADLLKPNQETTTYCNFSTLLTPNSDLLKGDKFITKKLKLEIAINFRCFFNLIKLPQNIFRYKTVTQQNGRLRWIPVTGDNLSEKWYLPKF